jgi:hypothetical protein
MRSPSSNMAICYFLCMNCNSLILVSVTGVHSLIWLSMP